MPNGYIRLPATAKRGHNIPAVKKGWRIVNPNQTRTFKANMVTKFNSPDGELFILYRILYPKRDGDSDE